MTQHHVVNGWGYALGMALNDIGERFARLTELRGASSEKIGSAAGVSRAQIDHIKSGRRLPTLGTLEKALDYLGADLVVSWRLRDAESVPVDVPTQVSSEIALLSELDEQELADIAGLLHLYMRGGAMVRGMLRGIVSGSAGQAQQGSRSAS